MQTLVSDDLVEIWLQTAIARRLSVQGQYTIALVELEPRLFLLQDVVQPADDSAKTFTSTRVEILSGKLGLDVTASTGPCTHHGLLCFRPIAVFRRMARSFTESRGDQPSKAAILNMLRGMLSAMRDNLSVSRQATRSIFLSIRRTDMLGQSGLSRRGKSSKLWRFHRDGVGCTTTMRCQ